MSTRLRDLMMRELPTLRHEPIDKRIRATLGGATVIDTVRALLVWEPRRVVPTYAVPVEDIDGEIARAPEPATPVETGPLPQLGDRPVLDPSVPFSVRSTDGEALVVRRDGASAAAFRPADADLDGYVIVDFDGFEAWFEEDERNVGHPRDPFHRIDIVHSSRTVQVSMGGEVLAESSAPYVLFEPPIPPRHYLPREDVRMDLLAPSDKRTFCAYKGEAHYLSLAGELDVAWFYPEPLREAAEVTGRIAFFNELVDIDVDGERLDRPVTPWSRR